MFFIGGALQSFACRFRLEELRGLAALLHNKVKPAVHTAGLTDYHTESVFLLGCVSKITKAHFRCLDMHIFVEKPRRSTTAPVFFASICKPIQQNCIFQTLETHPRLCLQNPQSAF
jgi:hypothetical protein